MRSNVIRALLLLAVATPCTGQQPAASSTLAGQAAFATIREVVRILEADPKTDWSKVNIEVLRQHLIDMDEVTMRSVVDQRDIPGGFDADVTGSGRAIDAIRRMTKNH